MRLLLVYVLVCVGFAACDKFKRLERLINILSNRVDSEVISRQMDMADKLAYLEMKLNESSLCVPETILQRRPENTPAKCPEQIHPWANVSDFQRILTAFKEEKKASRAMREQIPEIQGHIRAMESSLTAVSGDVKSISTFAPQVREGLAQMGQDLKDAKTDIAAIPKRDEVKDIVNETLASVSHVEKTMLASIMKTLESARESIQAISNKLDILDNRQKSLLQLLHLNSCLGYYDRWCREDGVYTIYPDGSPVEVYCDMTTDGGGWTVFQRRHDGSVDFRRPWDDYKKGFGDVRSEHWLGNDVLAAMTHECCHELRVELGDFEGNRRIAGYSSFRVSSEADNYTLHVDGYYGNAGDSLAYHDGMQFSTEDRVNDYGEVDCGKRYLSGWGYNKCLRSIPTGPYVNGSNTEQYRGNHWLGWHGGRYSLAFTEMKLR